MRTPSSSGLARIPSLLLALGVTLLLLLCTSKALADPVITPDKRPAIEAMLAPYAIGEPVRAGFVLDNMELHEDFVLLHLRSEEDGQKAELLLNPRQEGDPNASASFSFGQRGAQRAFPAGEALAEAVRANDRGNIYTEAELSTHRPDWSAAQRRGYLARVAGWGALYFLVLLGWRVFAGQRERWRDEAMVVGGSVFALTGVAAYAWVCNDATISMRYAWNLAHGYGLVFNIGERVQGFTNPLWTLALGAGEVLEPTWPWTLGLGLACTAGVLGLLWPLTRELLLGERARAPLFLGLLAVLFGCQPFLAFSSSGLENSATHLLVLACLLAAVRERLNWLLLFAALAVLNRLDTAPLLLPLVAWQWWRAGEDWRSRLRASALGLTLGTSLLCAWFGFATLYYGYPLPNTWYAKSGLDLGMGLTYLANFARLRPSSALVLLGAPLLTLRRPSPPLLRAIAWGCAAQLAYVVLIGGDYMHGRFLTAPMLCASVCAMVGLCALAEQQPKWRFAWPALALAAFAELVLLPIRPGNSAVVIERSPEHAIWAMGFGTITVPPTDTVDPERMPAISHHLIGHMHGEDPRIAWLDGYGLTDPFIARCPIHDGSRAGHFERIVPRAYLRARGDLRQLPKGRERYEQDEASVWTELEALRAEPGWWSEEHRELYEDLSLLTRGPLFAPERLRLIPRYLVSRRRLSEPPPPEHSFDILEADE